MFMIRYGIRYFALIATALIFLSGCRSPLSKYPRYVDTSAKKITVLPRKDFSFDKAQVYFSNDFDGSRLNSVIQVNDSVYSLLFEPENQPINNSAYFAFKLWSKSPQTLVLKFQYPKGYNHRYTPKLRYSSDNKWKSLDSTKISEDELGITTLRLLGSQDTLWVAAQEISTYEHTLEWTNRIAKNDYISLDNAGKSVQGRNIPVMEISRGTNDNKDIIVLLTRQHPPEVTGYFAFKAFLETLVNNSDLSLTFLDKYRVLAFPVMNPDGVDMGNWRHNSNGVDLNRDWLKYNQPEIRSVVNYINSISSNTTGKIILGLDFHSTWEDVFYTNIERESTHLPQFLDQWFANIEKELPNYKVNEKPGLSKRPVSKSWFLKRKAVGVTFEIGDETPRDSIVIVSRTAANEMMKILIGQ